MTKHKTLKQRVRERQQKTGERYTTALAHLKAHAQQKRLDSEEPLDVTALARRAGLACRATLSARLVRDDAGETERRTVRAFELLKGLLRALTGDAGAQKMAEVLLHAEPWSGGLPNPMAELADALRFTSEVAAGRRGVSASGRVAAFDAEGITLLAVLWAHPFDAKVPPSLYLSTLEAGDVTSFWGDGLALAGLGGVR